MTSGSRQSRDGKGAETRENILIEASRLFARRGYHGTTTRAIAAAVGISQPSLFFHFATKKAIVERLCNLDMVPAVIRLEGLLVGDGAPAAKVFALMVGETRYIKESPYDLGAQLSYEVLNDPDLAPYRALAARFDEMVRILIRAGQKTGEFRDIDAWSVQQLVVGFFSRATLFSSDLPPGVHDLDPEAVAELVVRALLVDQDRLADIRDEAIDLVRAYWSEWEEEGAEPDTR